MEKMIYKVAEHIFAIEGEKLCNEILKIEGFRPFEIQECKLLVVTTTSYIQFCIYPFPPTNNKYYFPIGIARNISRLPFGPGSFSILKFAAFNALFTSPLQQ